MKNNILINSLLLIGLIIILSNACKKGDSKPTPITPEPVPPATTVTDIDGHIYHFVTIGTQVWMLENLKVTRYRNGDSIPNANNNAEWGNISTGALCDYNNIPNNSATYGKLYNFFAVSDSRNIAPVGWHVPTDAELTTLLNYLGGDSIAGGKLKESDTIHWKSPNTGATNESGFTALPGGVRLFSGFFASLGNFAIWWTATESDTVKAICFDMFHDNSTVNKSGYNKFCGLSVRLIKD